jgi:hypothetical protein
MSKIADSIVAAAKTASTFPTGSKLEPPKKTMTIGAQRIGPATTAPNVTTPIGSVGEAIVIAPPDDPGRETPDIWQETPTWLLANACDE